MIYLFVFEDGRVWQKTEIDATDIMHCDDGCLSVFRLNGSCYEEYTAGQWVPVSHAR